MGAISEQGLFGIVCAVLGIAAGIYLSRTLRSRVAVSIWRFRSERTMNSIGDIGLMSDEASDGTWLGKAPPFWRHGTPTTLKARIISGFGRKDKEGRGARTMAQSADLHGRR